MQARTFSRLVQGQIAETVGPQDADPLDHYLCVVADKTGSLIATSALFGAKVAGADCRCSGRWRRTRRRSAPSSSSPTTSSTSPATRPARPRHRSPGRGPDPADTAVRRSSDRPHQDARCWGCWIPTCARRRLAEALVLLRPHPCVDRRGPRSGAAPTGRVPSSPTCPPAPPATPWTTSATRWSPGRCAQRCRLAVRSLHRPLFTPHSPTKACWRSVRDEVRRSALDRSRRGGQGAQAAMSSTVGAHSAEIAERLPGVLVDADEERDAKTVDVGVGAGCNGAAGQPGATERVCAVSTQASVSSITSTQRARVAVR